MEGSSFLLAILLSTVPSVHGLLFTPGSECQTYCSDGGGSDAARTNTSDIVCENKDFSNSGKGIKFKNCLSCLQKSRAVSGDDSDAHSFLYNLRYSFDVCLYSYPGEAVGGFGDTVCILEDACAPLHDALKTSLLDPSPENAYDYCDKAKDFEEGWTYRNCVKCLEASVNQSYFANFLVALKAGCEQRPTDGSLVGINNDVFSSQLVNITEPEEDISKRPKGAGSATLTTGAVVGIGVGCGLLFLGAGVLIFIHCRRQRRNAREKLDSPPPDTPGGLGFISSNPNDSKHMMSESISSIQGRPDFGHKRAYSTNTGYYNDPQGDKGGHGLGLSYHYDTQAINHGSVEPLPAHPAYIPKTMSRPSDRSRPPLVEPRFGDRPLGGNPVMATETPASLEHLNKRIDPSESPLLSGDSRILYG
ncbi:hypothetical protein ACO1O0_009052 [Amphichorda felina]